MFFLHNGHLRPDIIVLSMTVNCYFVARTI